MLVWVFQFKFLVSVKTFYSAICAESTAIPRNFPVLLTSSSNYFPWWEDKFSPTGETKDAPDTVSVRLKLPGAISTSWKPMLEKHQAEWQGSPVLGACPKEHWWQAITILSVDLLSIFLTSLSISSLRSGPSLQYVRFSWQFVWGFGCGLFVDYSGKTHSRPSDTHSSWP